MEGLSLHVIPQDSTYYTLFFIHGPDFGILVPIPGLRGATFRISLPPGSSPRQSSCKLFFYKFQSNSKPRRRGEVLYLEEISKIPPFKFFFTPSANESRPDFPWIKLQSIFTFAGWASFSFCPFNHFFLNFLFDFFIHFNSFFSHSVCFHAPRLFLIHALQSFRKPSGKLSRRPKN